MWLNSKKIVFILIVLLGFFLRIYQVDSIPPGLTWDEAALGYNAYSILKTGRDEYGTILPLNLKSFGDYKPALYAYVLIPFIAVFGLSEIAVRIPSVLFGVGTIIVLYFLIQKLFQNKKLSLAVSFMVAVSPLSIQFSRGAFESNAAVFLNSLGTLLFLIGLKKPKILFYSAVVLGLSLFTYQASKIFVPILVTGLLLIYRDDLRYTKTFFTAAFIFSLFFALSLWITFGLGQADRLSAQNFFAYTRAEEVISQIASEDRVSEKDFYFNFLHGEYFAYIRGFIERYFIYFSPKMLFIEGDYSPRHSVPDLGVLLYISLILIPLGILFLLNNENKKSRNLVLFLLFTAALPAVLSRDLISTNRSLNILIPCTILEGLGLYLFIFYILKLKKIYRYFVLMVFAGIFVFNYSIFVDRYFVHMPYEFSQDWLYGYKQVFTSLNQTKLDEYNKVVITDEYGQPYIYYLFYTKYPPQKFQQQSVLEKKSSDVGTVRKIDNIEFRRIDWPLERGDKNSLFIGTDGELPNPDIKPFPEYKILNETNFLDNSPALKIVEISK